MNKLLLTSVAASALMFAACSDTVVTDYQDAKATATVDFFVTDYYTGLKLPGADSAKVTKLAVDTLVQAVDSATGHAQFTKVEIGTYIFLVEAIGYAPVYFKPVVAESAGDLPRVYDLAEQVTLPKLGATVNGKVYYTNLDGQTLPMDAATVELKLGALPNDLSWPSEFVYTTTDANGSYSFANLPEGVGYTITVRQKDLNNKAYVTNQTVSASNVKAGETKTVASIVVDVNAIALTVLSTNYSGLQDITPSSVVTITFSDSVNTSLIRLGDIMVSRGGRTVLVTPTWSADNKTLSLAPADAGLWDLALTYTISLNLTSGKEQVLNTTGWDPTFVPSLYTAVPAAVSGFGQAKTDVVYWNATPTSFSGSTSFKVVWKASKDVSGYLIYYKGVADSMFVEGATSNVTDSSATVAYSFGVGIGGVTDSVTASLPVKIIPYNKFGQGPASAVLLIPIKKYVAP